MKETKLLHFIIIFSFWAYLPFDNKKKDYHYNKKKQLFPNKTSRFSFEKNFALDSPSLIHQSSSPIRYHRRFIHKFFITESSIHHRNIDDSFLIHGILDSAPNLRFSISHSKLSPFSQPTPHFLWSIIDLRYLKLCLTLFYD